MSINNSKSISYNKMENEKVLPLIISMSLPPLCSMFMQYSYNFIDCLFVSWISEDALTAVSLSFPLTTLMLAFSIGIGVGINVLISRFLGRKDFNLANSMVNHGLILATFSGIVLNIIALLIIKPYFYNFSSDPTLYKLFTDYMYICAFLQLPNMLHIAVQKIIQATGNMIAPMWFQIAGVVFNLVFDPILIFGLGPFPELGIKGAAISTVLGYTLSMILAFYVLIFTRQKVKIQTKNFKFDIVYFKEIIICGLPSFIMNALGAFMVSFANMFLIIYSTTAVAFFGAYFKAQQLVVMTVNGLIQGCIPIMSYNYGAQRFDRLKESFTYGTIIASTLMGLGSIILIIFPANILRFFMASDKMLELGIPALRIIATSYIFNGISTMIASYLQSIGQIKHSIVINVLRQLGLLLPLMWIFTNIFDISGVWYSFIITEILTCIYAYIIYRKKHI